MERISEILKQEPTTNSMSKNNLEIDTSRKPEPCKYCGKMLNYVYFSVLGKKVFSHLEKCDCPEAVAEEKRRQEEEERRRREEEQRIQMEIKMAKIESLFEQSKLGKRFRERTFENFRVTNENKKAFDIAWDYAQNFKEYAKQGQGLMFFSETYGTGKTHLAAAIANYLIPQFIPVIFGNVTSLLGKIRESYDDESQYSEEDVLDTLSNVDLLIIDDLGKERVSAWVEEKLYMIINERYENYKPIVVTTNLTLEQIENRFPDCGGAIVSRIVEMCRGVKLEGQDFRKRRLYGGK